MLAQKDLLSTKTLQRGEINEILDLAKNMKQILVSPSKKTAHLTGKSIITLFYENSTRTRLSFELAAKYMSAASANVSASSSSVSKGESLIDTGRTIDKMGTDIIIIRHPHSGSAHLLAKNVKASVINGGDGSNEHPSQALLDMFTMKNAKGELKGLKVMIAGDILHSRVARSNIWALNTMGADVTLVAPATFLPKEFEQSGIKIGKNIKEAARGADVLMALRVQRERQKGGMFPSEREYAHFFSLDEEVLALADSEAIVMHPGPMNRGVEIQSSVADSNHSEIDEQVANGLAIRMALMFLLTRRKSA